MTINFQKSQIDLVSKFVFWSLFEVCILIFDISHFTYNRKVTEIHYR